MKLATATAPKTATTIPGLPAFGNGYETNYSKVHADLTREVYADTYKLLQQLSRAQIEGVLEVTVRTRTGSMTIPLGEQAGRDMAQTLCEGLGEKLDKLEKDILECSQRAEQEEADDEDGTSGRAQVFAFCLPMRPLSDAEFLAMPAEARRTYDEHRAERAAA